VKMVCGLWDAGLYALKCCEMGDEELKREDLVSGLHERLMRMAMYLDTC
jgi:hypothetical protein